MKLGLILIIVLGILSFSFIIYVVITKDNNKKEEDLGKEQQDLLVIGQLARRVIHIKGHDKSKIKKLAFQIREKTKIENLTKFTDKSSWVAHKISTLTLATEFLDEILDIVRGPDTRFKERLLAVWQIWMYVDKGKNIRDKKPTP